MTHVETIRQYQRSRREDSPLGLFISAIHESGADASERKRKGLFKALLLREGYEDFLDGVINEWMAIKYTTAVAAAFPPTTKEVAARAKAARKQKESAEQENAKARHLWRVKIVERMLALQTVVGKSLAQCTGRECLQMGGMFTAIGERLKPDETVENGLSVDELLKIIPTAMLATR